MSVFKLRPHHSLCISFFEGKGYSDKFTESMTGIIRMLDNENPFINPVSETDIICENCPNNNMGICITSEKVYDYDKRVLKLCEISENTKIKWKDFHDTAVKNIIKTGKISEVCSDCSWRYICNEKSRNYK
jgi:hypothetical protein